MLFGKLRFLTRFCRRGSLNYQAILAFLLACFILLQWQRRKDLKKQVTKLSETLTIYRQMRAYSENVCSAKQSSKTDKGFDIRPSLNTAKVDLNKVTFIFVSHSNLRCANERIKKLRESYPMVKIILVFKSVNFTQKQYHAGSFPLLQKVVNLGGFSSYPEALKNAVLRVKTKYFMLLDSELSSEETSENFVQKLMGYMHSFHVLGGSVISLDNEFRIACHSLHLKNWTFFEKFEYNTSGNVLKCESTSQYFLADVVAFQAVLDHIDPAMGKMWQDDFFLRVKELLTIGMVPEVIFKKSSTMYCPVASHLNSKKEIDLLLPFVNKHHVLDFVNGDGNRTTICDGMDPLICSEKYIFPKWKLRHWAYSGLTAFPFIIQRLIDALRFGTSKLEENQIPYILEGGTLLGFIKVRAVLPWDSGDVDTFVYSSRRSVIDLVKEIQRNSGYEYLLRWNAFHIYVTSYYPMHDGLIVYAVSREEPGPLVRIRMHGRLFPAPRSMFKFLREYYGSSYLESRIRFGDERVSCDYDGYQACMPDCRWNGCGSGRHQFPGILT